MSYTSAVHPVLKTSSEVNVTACLVLLSPWCCWISSSLCVWKWPGIAKHLSESAWQNLTVSVLTDRPVASRSSMGHGVHLGLLKRLKETKDKAKKCQV